MAEQVDPRRARLLDDARRLALVLDENDADHLLSYLDLLHRWNATYNLTAVRDPERMMTRHVADCMAVVPPLRRHWGDKTPRRVLDVGSGGGLPGVVIAILNPDTDVTCVDAVGKKAAFIQQVAANMHLPNLHSRHDRVEQMKAEAPFDIVTSRAFASLADFVDLTRQHVATNGTWLAMKGKDPIDERAALPPDIEVFHVEHVDVPGLDAERCLVWMRPKASL